MPPDSLMWGTVAPRTSGQAAHSVRQTGVLEVQVPPDTPSDLRESCSDFKRERPGEGSFWLLAEVILIGMTSRVGPKGQVVIPKEMRDRLGIVPGDEVDFALENNAVRIEPVHEMQSLRGRLAGLGKSY